MAASLGSSKWYESESEFEQTLHESEDFARDANSLIVGVYASGVFDEPEAWHLAALGYVTGQHVLDYGCGTAGTTGALLARNACVTGFDISRLLPRGSPPAHW